MWFRLFILFLFLLGLPAQGADVRFAWDPNTETDLAGYRLYRGTQSRQYTESVNVGNVTAYTWTVPDAEQYFAVTAYNAAGESGFSNEVQWSPAPQPIAAATGVNVEWREVGQTMAVELTGTPVAIGWGNAADPAGQAVTIPADATAVYMFWSFFNTSETGYGLLSATLNGNSPNQVYEVAGDSDQPATGVAVWYSPATGAQTLDVRWDYDASEGPITIVAFVKGGNVTAWRDADAANPTGTTVTVTVDSNATDLVLKLDQKYYTTAPSTSSGWTSKLTQTYRDESARLSSANSPGASSTVCNCEDEEYSSIVAVSIPAAAAAGLSIPVAMYHYLHH